MPKQKETSRNAILTTVLALLLVSCTHNSSKTSDQRPCVSVSVAVESYFVERLAGDAVTLNVMIPQSADHDAYTPRPSQMKELSSSDLYLAIGPLEFETTWKERLTTSAPRLQWVDLSEGIELMKDPDGHEEDDPHFWLSPRQASIMASNVARALRNAIPEKSNSIDSALCVLQADIALRDSAMMHAATTAKSKTFMIYHPALTYLARDYGLHQIAIEKDGALPSAHSLMDGIDEAQAAKAPVIFVQQGYDVQRAQLAARQIGMKIVTIAPESPNWEATMDSIITNLAQ